MLDIVFSNISLFAYFTFLLTLTLTYVINIYLNSQNIDTLIRLPALKPHLVTQNPKVLGKIA